MPGCINFYAKQIHSKHLFCTLLIKIQKGLQAVLFSQDQGSSSNSAAICLHENITYKNSYVPFEHHNSSPPGCNLYTKKNPLRNYMKVVDLLMFDSLILSWFLEINMNHFLTWCSVYHCLRGCSIPNNHLKI